MDLFLLLIRAQVSRFAKTYTSSLKTGFSQLHQIKLRPHVLEMNRVWSALRRQGIEDKSVWAICHTRGLPGFDDPSELVEGVEYRVSVRLWRNEREDDFIELWLACGVRSNSSPSAGSHEDV